MGLLVAFLVVAAVIVLFVTLRPRSSDDTEAGPEGTSTGLRPLLGIPMSLAPDGWVEVGSFGHNEAQVVRGLLDSCGVRAVFEATGPHAPAEVMMPTGVTRFHVYVSPDDADTARELLES